MSRFPGRIHIFARALPKLLFKPLRCRPAQPSSVLVAHHLLLGDTLLLTPLLAKLREQYPDARIALACPKAIAPLFARAPFGVEALAFDPRDAASVRRLVGSGPFDLGIVAADNRHSWLALAAGCRWIVAHGGDSPAWKNWPVDELRPYPDAPAAWGDLVADLIDGPPPQAYRPEAWPAPPVVDALPKSLLERPYVVLHPGASTRVKRWPVERWRALADNVAAAGYLPVWSGGKSEVDLIDEIGARAGEPNLAGRLGLGDLWHLYAGAQAVVCPDTGVAHLARLVGVPTVALFGPGSAVVHGAGRYWREVPFVAVTIADMPCRDQPYVFRRHVRWIRRCDRDVSTCVAWHDGSAACMSNLSTEAVRNALQQVLVRVR
ncbi:glycosyltransferase family 9 protein [Burkholderia multivorans]|uniref:glycosyltransferase family 9 protein n=1 Tax=Burkholderia multivorans TaxID=87883 RepID=UPI000277E724|nr:glycosyltransferase family 9 protein [Burkholderia multivorans]EJO55733.1 heptosyltransferase domain protein [Burkholderia multivorans CF2]MBJ9656416.1 glycosyltransferase family 9 protein [Burkholderia multivorans]MBU9282201.1 glycosyltransferase family 9 protein [Burkholderia multivorans]